MTTGKTVATKKQITYLRGLLAKAVDPEKAIEIGAAAAGMEEVLRKAGLYRPDDLRPARELWLDSRWVLGGMLRKMERGTGPGRGKKKEHGVPSFLDAIARLGLQKPRAIEAQRISALPVEEKTKAYATAARLDVLPTIEGLVIEARPWWFKASREDRHAAIVATAVARREEMPEKLGPFPLIYADPPWKFETYSEMGLDRTPDQHYPTMTDDEIASLKVFGVSIADLAGKDAALLLWCTSSNLKRAMAIMEAWGFEYKTQAIWDKDRTGMGLVFRNQHEPLLYGTRGEMPGPQYQPPSIFRYPRGRHSAKPPEIRREIEKMYPDFDADTRIELFAREKVNGWTVFGFESGAPVDQAAE